jgi:hypothetical protein
MTQYTYRAEWSPEYHEYVAVCLEYPYRYSRAPTAHEAIECLEREIAEVVDDMVAAGARPPASLTDRQYSGNLRGAIHPPLTTCSSRKIGGLWTRRSATIDW